MCLILLALGVSREFPLVVAANRDEAYARPAARAQAWDDPFPWWGGRDLTAGGTWLGVRPGRIAAVTNLRGGHVGTLSRGQLVLQALAGEAPLEGDYSDFNLLWGSPEELWHYNSAEGERRRVEPGYHGLSNASLDTPWPKVLRGVAGLQQSLEPEALFQLLQDRRGAPDDQLPDTGVGLELERHLSPIFLETHGYGTRCSTLVYFRADGSVELRERVEGNERKISAASSNERRRAAGS